MRALRFTAITFVALSAIALSGCSSDDPAPAAVDDPASASTTPTPEASDTATADDTETASSSGSGDFPEVDGYTYADLPDAAFASLDATLKATPQIKGVDAQLVKKGSEEVGLVMNMAIDPAAVKIPGFEDGFLPGFAGGIAGSSAKPKYQKINGTSVVTIATPDKQGTAYAWLNDATATILVFKDAADADAFAAAALG